MIGWARLAALIAVSLVLASCAASGKTAASTPTIAGKQPAKGGPVVSSQPPANSAPCIAGATNEPLWSYRPPRMTSDTAGWGIGSCTLGSLPTFPNGSTLNCYAGTGDWMGILRTANGGATWTDVSPSSLPNRTWHHAQFFLDSNHAWVEEVTRDAGACASQATTFMTSDGGQTWRQGGSIALKLSAPEDDVFNISGPKNFMEFIDTQHGWLEVASPPSHPAGPGQMTMLTYLYATTDGGMHWRLMATNPGQSLLSASGCTPGIYQPGSDVMFASPSVGWLAIACPPGSLMLLTRDGGATWSARPYPQCSCQVYNPQVFDADHVIVTGIQGSTTMLATADGGTTWVQRSTPQAAMTDFSFTDADHGWMVGIAQLPTTYETVVYRTADGGAHWNLVSKPGFTAVASNAKAYYPINGAEFVSDTVGFVVLGGEAGTAGQQDPGLPDMQLLRTSDGGQTWKVVLKHISVAVCSSGYGQAGRFGGGKLTPVKMASPTVGWAQGGLRTADGGAHWHDVSSPALREGAVTTLYPPGYTDFFQDGDHAWQAAEYGSGASCADHLSTFATADGGKTWQKSAPIPISLQSGAQVAALQIGFTDALAGWLWIPIGPRNVDFIQPTDADLYATADGGLTWRRVSHLSSSQLKAFPTPPDSQNCTPTIGPVTFASQSVGWMGLNCAVTQMLVTRDGGVTWKPQTFPDTGAGCPCYFNTPNFLDADHGMIVVSGQGGLTASTKMLATSDGGATWQTTPAPGTGYVLIIDWVTASDLFALVTPPGWTKGPNVDKQGFELYRSSDGARTWTKVAAPVPATWPPGFMQFVDLKHGFEANTNGADVLLTTTDGGVTWKSITPAVG